MPKFISFPMTVYYFPVPISHRNFVVTLNKLPLETYSIPTIHDINLQEFIPTFPSNLD